MLLRYSFDQGAEADLLDPHLGALEERIAARLQRLAPLIIGDRLLERHLAPVAAIL